MNEHATQFQKLACTGAGLAAGLLWFAPWVTITMGGGLRGERFLGAALGDIALTQSGQHIGGVGYALLAVAGATVLLPWFGRVVLAGILAAFGAAVAGYIAFNVGGQVLMFRGTLSWGLPATMAAFAAAAAVCLLGASGASGGTAADDPQERRTPTL